MYIGKQGLPHYMNLAAPAGTIAGPAGGQCIMIDAPHGLDHESPGVPPAGSAGSGENQVMPIKAFADDTDRP